jgi:hypothetical protein
MASVGARSTRIEGLRAIAAEHRARGNASGARAALVVAVAEARRGGKALFDETLAACAAAWPRL